MTAPLPGWDNLTDPDKGAVLLHLHKRDWEGDGYAVENYPARYFDHPDLTDLSPAEASAHAASLGSCEDLYNLLGEAEFDRLYELALAADRERLHAEMAAEATGGPAMTVPPEAATNAAVAIYQVMERHRRAAGALRHVAKAAVEALTAAAPLIAAAERDRIYDQVGGDHYVIYTEDRWTIEHSVECRLSGQMHECAYHAAVADAAVEYDSTMLGRWRITGIDGEGEASLERADLLAGES